MAIVNNGTLNGLAPERLPIGYTLPTTTVILDYHYKINTVISLPVSTTALSTAVATMGAIVTGTNSGITTFLTANYLATANITAYSIINNVTTNFAPTKNNTAQTFLKSSTVNAYLVSVTIYVKAI